MIWIKRVGLLIFLLLLLVAAMLAYVTMTNGGMQRIFSLSQSYLTDELTIGKVEGKLVGPGRFCLLYTSPSPRDGLLSRMPSSA